MREGRAVAMAWRSPVRGAGTRPPVIESPAPIRRRHEPGRKSARLGPATCRADPAPH
jgi:hypothetical protein